MSSIDRRNFLKLTASAAALLGWPLGSKYLGAAKRELLDPTRDPLVPVVRDTAAHTGSTINGGIVQGMIDEAVRRLTGISNTGEAYLSLFPGLTLDSVIGIKVNCINSALSSHPAVSQALAAGLQKMTLNGTPFPANNIIIWDRTTYELTAAGYTLNTGATGVRCFASNSSGVGYSTIYLNCNGSQQHPSRILTDYCDYLISLGVLKNHSFAGATFSMKNHYGSIQYPGNLHGGYCAQYVPAVNQQIRDVLPVVEALFMVDGIFGIYNGGPGGSPNFTYDGVILGQDRVAVDAVCRDILQSYGCPTLGISTHIDLAAGAPYYLGTANLAQIQRVDVMNPSAAVTNLEVTHAGSDALLSWPTPEYTGQFKVLRADNPAMTGATQLAVVSGNAYTDPGVVNAAVKYFYRVVKTW
ncbi:MAG: DUF362 domain-containing protein [Candidatus Zixiibacteriota bacterium]|nr:MAG: DUF362 domain-containing protein [candidate division Zixibacteria bacterium]